MQLNNNNNNVPKFFETDCTAQFWEKKLARSEDGVPVPVKTLIQHIPEVEGLIVRSFVEQIFQNHVESVSYVASDKASLKKAKSIIRIKLEEFAEDKFGGHIKRASFYKNAEVLEIAHGALKALTNFCNTHNEIIHSWDEVLIKKFNKHLTNLFMLDINDDIWNFQRLKELSKELYFIKVSNKESYGEIVVKKSFCIKINILKQIYSLGLTILYENTVEKINNYDFNCLNSSDGGSRIVFMNEQALKTFQGFVIKNSKKKNEERKALSKEKYTYFESLLQEGLKLYWAVPLIDPVRLPSNTSSFFSSGKELSLNEQCKRDGFVDHSQTSKRIEEQIGTSFPETTHGILIPITTWGEYFPELNNLPVSFFIRHDDDSAKVYVTCVAKEGESLEKAELVIRRQLQRLDAKEYDILIDKKFDLNTLAISFSNQEFFKKFATS